MADKLMLTVHIDGTNIMGNPLLKAHGYYRVRDKSKEIKIETPITSIPEFVKAFEELFKA
ncbi:MAG: hypothetical protein Q8N42_02005 [bacterium]|nr:hypothetical protein [bacterium]